MRARSRGLHVLSALCFTLLCGASTPAWPAGGAGEAELALRLDETIRLALRHNRTVVGARMRRTTQKFELEVAEDRYRPRASIEASAFAERDRKSGVEASFGPSMRIPTGGRFLLRWSEPMAGRDKDAGSWELALAQPLLKGFGPKIDTAPLRVARIGEEIQLLALRDTIAGVVTSVIRAYRAVIRAGREIEISRESLARARTQLETNRSLIRAGRMAAREIVQTEAELANRELALMESRNSLESANAALIDILDIDGIPRIRASATLAVKPVRPDRGQSVETAMARRPDHLQALLRVETAKIALRRAKNDLLWDLSLNAGVKRGARGRTDHSVGITLHIPLGDRSPKLRLLRAANDLRHAKMALAESRQAIRIAVRQAVHDVVAGFRRTELSRQARELAEQKLDLEQRKLEQGLTSTFRLTTVEDDLVRAQNRELNAILGYLDALTALDRAQGTTLDRWGIEIERTGDGPGRLGP